MGTQSSSSSSGGGNVSQKMGRLNQTSRAVLVGRLLFITFLLISCIALAYGAYALLRNTEHDLAERQFETLAKGLLDTVLFNFVRKREGMSVMANFYGDSHGNSTTWPFVSFTGFENIAFDLLHAIRGCPMAFVPFVSFQDLDHWEEYAYDLYDNLGYPNGTGKCSTGRRSGVWCYDYTTINQTYDNKGMFGYFPEETPRQLFHVAAKGKYDVKEGDVVAPVLQHTKGPYQKMLMQDLMTDPAHRSPIEKTLECVHENADKIEAGESVQCSHLDKPFGFGGPENEPVSIMSTPIFAKSDNTTIVGVIQSQYLWKKLFRADSGVDESLNGMVFVFSSSSGDEWGWIIEDGLATYLGKGEHTASMTPNLKQESIVLNPPGEMFSNSTLTFTITIAPSQAFVDSFKTSNPLFALAGTVVIVLLTSLFFAGYDCYVRREFSSKRRLLDAKRDFMRFISHEVRTPLNSVCMGLTLLQEEMEEGIQERQVSNAEKDLCKQIQSNAQSAVDVLNDILNYDKIEAGKLNLELGRVEVWGVIQDTVAEFTLPAQLKKINLILAGIPDDCHNLDELQRVVVGDPVRITQVLRNLISNAIKFTPRGGLITVHVQALLDPKKGSRTMQEFDLQGGEVVSFVKSGDIHLSVTDTGAGLTKPQLKKMFSNGVQFDVNRLQGGNGSGVGLFIAKGIVECHGGTLEVDSLGLGRGTTFTLTLPLYKEEVTETGAAFQSEEFDAAVMSHSIVDDEESPYISAHDDTGPLRVLVVDDSMSNRKFLSRLMEKRGHSVVDAEDGQQAVITVQNEQTEGNTFDVVCMDFQMPVMDGPTATRELRAIGCDAYIVGITGNVLPEDVALFKEAGANAVLPKPFKVNDLEALWIEHHVVGKNSTITADHYDDLPNIDCSLKFGKDVNKARLTHHSRSSKRISSWLQRNRPELNPTATTASSAQSLTQSESESIISSAGRS